MTAQIIKNIQNGDGEYCTEKNGECVTIHRTETGTDAYGNMYGGIIMMRYGRDGFSPHNSEIIQPDDVERRMRRIEPDLRKWFRV